MIQITVLFCTEMSTMDGGVKSESIYKVSNTVLKIM
jgi:hypothetical protein